MYEAERSGKDEVVGWLLSEGKGLEKAVGGGDGGEKEIDEEAGAFEGADEGERDRMEEKREVGDGVEDVQNGVAGMKVEEKGG